jgi:hypothetical protein
MTSARELYRIDGLPIFQNRMYDSPEDGRNCPRGDVRLVEDRDSGLIYNASFRPELMIYGESYQNEQALSPRFLEHLNWVAGLIEREMGRGPFLEIGCGKGAFLEMLLARGLEGMGVDPAYDGSNRRVVKESFTPALGLRADAVILRHVLEHIPNPSAFLEQISAANGRFGTIYIEVPCLDWICEHRVWFDIFYEHVNYFRLSDLRRMFGSIRAAGHCFGGQYIYVIADLASLRAPRYREADKAHFPADFLASLPKPRPPGDAQVRVVWGGASKGVIFAFLSERTGAPVDAVIDINPAKQGRYLPGTGLRVQAPDELLPLLPQGSTIYVMNSNYLTEIAEMSGGVFDYVGLDRVATNQRKH